MSLISLIATDKFISFMSDGRATKVENDEIHKENYKKIKKVNDKIIYGIAGSYEASEIIKENIHAFDSTNAKTFNQSMFEQLGKGKVNKELHILIGGLDENNQIYYGGFSQFSIELTEISPHKYNPPINFASTAINVECDISNQERLRVLIEKDILNALKLKGAKAIQEKLNAQVNMIDNTVNTVTYHEYIKR